MSLAMCLSMRDGLTWSAAVLVVASIAVHTVDREEAYARLAELGWLLVPEEAEDGAEAALAADG